MGDQTIAVFKLITGEELVAEYKNDGEFYILKAPRKIVLMPVGPGQFVPKLMPWFVSCADGVFPIHSGHVVSVAAQGIDEKLFTAYQTEISGIDLSAATPKSIIA